MRNSAKTFAVSAAALLASGSVFAQSGADIDASMYPYKSGVPSAAGFTPGTEIDSVNVDRHQPIMDEALYRLVKDGFVTVETKETEAQPLHSKYVEATRKNAGTVTLGSGVGEIMNHVAGRPFPTAPSLNDPRAGEKIIWNYRYGFNGGDGDLIDPFYWEIRDAETGAVSRRLRFAGSLMKFAQRTVDEPVPAFADNPSGVYRAIYQIFSEPFDLNNTQLLIYAYLDDSKRDDAWLYLGFQRRVRRLATGQVTDAYLGTDIMIEDFEGYNTRVREYAWKYLGTVNVLLPFYRHNELKRYSDDPGAMADGYKFAAMHGKGNCFIDVPYQLRVADIVEGSPVEAGHPISKRRMWVDRETATIPRQMIFDRSGALWKHFSIGKAHPDFHLPVNKGTGVPLDDSAQFMDVQGGSCTTLKFRTQIVPHELPLSRFTVQNLRVSGR